MAPICPQCGREAPIVYRGVVPYCTACGALRAPLSSPSVNMAGTPSKVGGTAASVLGWLVLLFGGSLALGLGGLLLVLQAPIGAVLAVSLPILLVVLVLGVALLRGGRSLNRSGHKAEQDTRTQALLAMAAHRGQVRAVDAARALGIGVAEADAMLTELAKREPDRVAVDVDDDGVVWYRVASAPGDAIPRMRIGPDVRVASVDVPADDVADPVRRAATQRR